MSTPHDLAPLFTACFRGVLRASWQGSLAIGLVLLARRALGARVPARWHYLLWFLVLARLLVPAVVLPHSPASLENLPALAHPFGHPPSILRRDVPVALAELASSRPRMPARSSVARPAPRPVAMSLPSSKTWSPWICAAWVWLGGVLLLAGWLAACVVRLRGRLRREAFPAEESVLAIWQACCRRWRRHTPPRLLVADWVDSPALMGWWRPTLLIPQRSLDAFTAQDWEHVFAHEIAHLRWRDHWSQVFLLAAGCIHWFNPVVWLGLRRLRADRELAADEWVLRHLQDGRALAYGETLFKTLAQQPARLVFQPGMVGLSEDGAQMKQRLQRIAAFLPQRRLSGSLVGFAVVLGLGTVVLGQSSPGPLVPRPPRVSAQPLATAATASVVEAAAKSRQLSDAMLAAARAGDGTQITSLIDSTFRTTKSSATPPAPKFSAEAATAMLDELVRQRELTVFTVLHDQLKQTNYGKDWEPNDALLVSLVKDGRTDFLDVLLARRLNLDRLKTAAKSADGPTAEWIARRVAEVAKQRADVEALEKAADEDDLAAMKQPIDGGADVNGVGKEDNTPLIEAVFKNRVAAARLLLDRGALVDKVRYPGWDYTPLCLCNSVEMAQLLKDRGADLHAKLWRRDVNILVYVAEFASADLVEWFLKQGADPKMLGDSQQTLLYGLHDGRTAQILLDAGVDPNHVDQFGVSALATAQTREVAQVLLDHGAKVTGFREPLLRDMVNHFAAGGAVELAIQAGAEHPHNMVQWAMVQAASGNNDSLVKALLKQGAAPNEMTEWGLGQPDRKVLPINQTCANADNLKAMQVLLDAGANPNAGKYPGILLKSLVRRRRSQELINLVLKGGARGVSELAFAVVAHDGDKIRALLAAAPTYEENPAFWAEVLPSAAREGNLVVVQEALSKKASLALGQAVFGDDALSAAASKGQVEALKLLLASRPPKADPGELRSALRWAAESSNRLGEPPQAEQAEKCVAMLLTADAPVTGYSSQQDPLVAAVFSRFHAHDLRVIEMLVQAGADPNPLVSYDGEPPVHLLEDLRSVLVQGNCSAELVETMARLSEATTTPRETSSQKITPQIILPAVRGHADR